MWCHWSGAKRFLIFAKHVTPEGLPQMCNVYAILRFLHFVLFEGTFVMLLIPFMKPWTFCLQQGGGGGLRENYGPWAGAGSSSVFTAKCLNLSHGDGPSNLGLQLVLRTRDAREEKELIFNHLPIWHLPRVRLSSVISKKFHFHLHTPSVWEDLNYTWLRGTWVLSGSEHSLLGCWTLGSSVLNFSSPFYFIPH